MPSQDCHTAAASARSIFCCLGTEIRRANASVKNHFQEKAAMPKKTQKQVFWFSFFLVLLLFFAAALFMVAEYNTVRSGYTPQPPLYRFVRQIMEPVSRAVRPVLQWFHLV